MTQTTIVLIQDETVVATWRLERCGRPGLALVDELARLQLTAGRVGWTVRVRDAEPALRELLHLVGLSELLGS